MSFGDDLEAFAKKYEVTADELVQGTLLEMGNSLIEMSPVDTGRFRGNWQHQSAMPANYSNVAFDPSGSATSARIAASLESVKAGGVEYITNNLPYAQPLEYGSSSQAPQGMVRVTVARFQDILGDTLRALV